VCSYGMSLTVMGYGDELRLTSLDLWITMI
jgi:hypothetical protein